MTNKPLETTITVAGGLSRTVRTEPLKTAQLTQRAHTRSVKEAIRELSRAAIPDDWWDELSDDQRTRIVPRAMGVFAKVPDPDWLRKLPSKGRNWRGEQNLTEKDLQWLGDFGRMEVDSVGDGA